MKRGSSGLSLLIAVNKPTGMSSHDVVNRVRRVFGERRVGHTGTLDPLACGVLPVCIGPASRLDAYMVGHDKTYRTRIALGSETDTCDLAGTVTAEAPVPPHILDEEFANSYLAKWTGPLIQTPPAYSAVKINGQAAYKRARRGEEVEIKQRLIEVYSARLLAITGDGASGGPCWDVEFRVSKGTYIRSLARDIGRDLGCLGHVALLERTLAGNIALEDCVTLETLETLGADVCLDPVRVLGVRFAFADAHASRQFGQRLEACVANGRAIPPEWVQLYEPLSPSDEERYCACTCGVCPSGSSLADGELVAVIQQNRLKAMYRFDAADGILKPDCVFAVGVSRGL